MKTRTKYQQELDDLVHSIRKMQLQVDEMIEKALFAVSEHRQDTALEVVEADSEVDAQELLIEDRCAAIIATEQPVASDLRNILAILKIAWNIERIGDYAVHLAKAVRKVSVTSIRQAYPHIESMARTAAEMLGGAIFSLIEKDSEGARKIAERDRDIDATHRQLYDEIVAMMKSDPESIGDGSKLLVLNRFLERLGDHVTNICECIAFIVTGRHEELG